DVGARAAVARIRVVVRLLVRRRIHPGGGEAFVDLAVAVVVAPVADLDAAVGGRAGVRARGAARQRDVAGQAGAGHARRHAAVEAADAHAELVRGGVVAGVLARAAVVGIADQLALVDVVDHA